MAKKHYPKPRSSPPQPAHAELEALEAQARENLAAGKFRKARDIYKLLCKQDRERFLSGLIEANTSLMGEMLDRGLVSEADQVMAYLKTIAPPVALAGLEVGAALRRADWTGALAAAAKVLEGAPSGQPAVADALVLAFDQEPKPNAPALPEQVKSELAAVLGALEGVAREDYGAAQDLLRPLPRESMFAGWKMLIKGMAAFHTGEREKADALLSRVPEGGVPARAAAAYRALGGHEVPEDVAGVERMGRLFGVDGLGPVVSHADRLWRTGSVVESYNEMRKFRDFPSEETGPLGALSDFYFKCFGALRENLSDRFLGAFYERLSTNRCKSDEELRLTCLTLLREDLKLPDFDSLHTADYPRQFLEHSSPDDPQARKMAAIAFEKLGSFNATLTTPNAFGFGRERMRDPELAKAFLLESIGHDGDYLPAYLKLVEVYDFLKEAAERNRLLDQMTRRFPDEKEVLIPAGVHCGERKAYFKAIEYLERARALDPLDQKALLPLITSYIHVALQDYKKGALAKARNTFETLFKIADRGKVETALGLDFMLARQSIFERLFGEPEAAIRQEAAARRAALSKPALIYFLHVYFRAKAPAGQRSPYWEELQQTHPQSALERYHLVRSFLCLSDVCQDLDLREEALFIEHGMDPLLHGRPDLDEIVKLLEMLAPVRGPLDALAEKLSAAGLKENAEHPRLRLLKFIRQGDRFTNPDLMYQQLDTLREDAGQAGDVQTVKMTGELIRSLGLDDTFSAGPWMPGGGPFDEGEDEEDWENDFADEGGPLGLPPEIAETMEAIALMKPDELRKFRRDMIKEGTPEALVDDLIESLRTGLPPKTQFPGAPPPQPATPNPQPPPVSKRRPHRRDDNQPELF